MMNEALLDVNLLIACVVENHVDHRKARRFLSSLDRFYTTPTIQGGFLRFLTRPWKDEKRIDRPPRMTVRNALGTLREVVELPSHAFLADDEPFVNVSLLSMSGHRQWTDAYLIRLARKNGVRFATLERKLQNMDDSRAPVLLIIG